MEKPSILETITKIIFIGGAILVFAILAYLIIIWVPKAINGIANVGSSITDNLKKGETIEVIVNQKEVDSGSPISVSWKYSETTPGEYYVSYDCKESLIFDIKSTNNSKRIICNTPFRLGKDINSITLIPTVTKKNIFIDSQIKISYKDLEENKEVAFGTADISVKNTDESTIINPYEVTTSNSVVTSKEVTPQTPTYKAPVTYTNYGKADLLITNIGSLDNSAFSFIVYNYGTKNSGNWYFTYTDAENPGRTVLSPIQMSLGPNQGILNTVRFYGQKNRSQVINIFIDSTNSVSESNESNNTSSVTIYGDNKNSSYNDYDEDDDADLVIDEFEVGRMSGSRFVEDNEIDEDDDAAIKFVVRNQGGESTGNWKYEVTNTPNDDDYKSGRQSSLRPGEKVEIIVEFENPDEGTYLIRVEVDSDDDVDEERENNNTETERLKVTN